MEVEESVIELIRQRRAQEEALDLAIYLQKIQQELLLDRSVVSGASYADKLEKVIAKFAPERVAPEDYVGRSESLAKAQADQPELSDSEIARIDEVHNSIHELIAGLAGEDPDSFEWDIELIASISDLIEDAVCGKWGLMTRHEFCPYTEVQ